MTDLILAPLPRLTDHKRGPELDAARDKAGNRLGSLGLAETRGLQLLHRHFVVRDDEGTTEYLDGEVLRTHVISRREIEARRLAPSTLRVAPDGSLIPIQWDEDRTADAEVERGLEELGRFLAEQGMASTFAIVSVSPDAIKLGPGQTLLETTDVENRTQETRAVSSDLVGPEDVATWTFINGPQGFQGCIQCHCMPTKCDDDAGKR